MLTFKVAHNSLSVFVPIIIFFSNGNLLHNYTLDSGILRSIRPTAVELSSDSCRTIINSRRTIRLEHMSDEYFLVKGIFVHRNAGKNPVPPSKVSIYEGHEEE